MRSCSIKSITTKTLATRRVNETLKAGAPGAGDVLGQGVADDDLAHAHDVLVPARHERGDLAQGGDGEAVLFFLELELFECDDVPRLLVAGAEDDAVGAFLDLV